MSPVAQTRTVPALGPRGGERKVTITPNTANKTIAVTWFCGTARRFDVESLRRIIELVDGPGTKHPMWLNPTDRDRSAFWTRITDGELTANDRMTANGSVSWPDLKRALQATIAEVLS